MRKFLLFFLLSIFSSVYAQTGINTGNIHQYAAFQVDALEGGKGVIVPRLTSEERDLINVEDAEDGLTIYNVEEDCINYWSLGDKQWKSICGKEGSAKFTITSCASIEVSGSYLSETAVNKSHFITVSVNVEKPGEYQISAVSTPNNGYYYYVSGEFPTTGIFTLRVPAVGKVGVYNKTRPNDTFTVSINGEANNGVLADGQALPACTFIVKTEDSSVKPSYSWNCRSIEVHGVYKMHGELDPNEHYIKIKITSDPSAVGAIYRIESDVIDGIQFSGSGELVKGEMEVILRGSGKIYSSAVKNFTLTSNSVRGIGQCTARVRVVIPKKRLLTLGKSKNNFGYNFSGTAASNKLITTTTNYGDLPNSVVAFAGWDAIIDGGNSIYDSELEAMLINTSTPVDVVVLGYSYYVTPTQAEIFAEYLKKGGVMLAFTESNVGAANLLRAVTGNTSIAVKNGPGAGSVYQFSAVDDTLLNGPFGDLRNKYWGEDASRTSLVSGIDRNSVHVYSTGLEVSSGSASSDGSALSAFRLKDHSFLYVGDGGFNSNNGGGSKVICPFMLDKDSKPIVKTTYGKHVSNALFTANAFAWAIEEAERNGSQGN